MADYDSQDDNLDLNDQPRKRQKRHAFQSFAQRVTKVGHPSDSRVLEPRWGTFNHSQKLIASCIFPPIPILISLLAKQPSPVVL